MSLPNTHPSKILFTNNNLNNNVNRLNSYKWPPFHILLNNTKNILQQSKQTLVTQNVNEFDRFKNINIDDIKHTMLNTIYHHMLIVQCQDDKSKGIKKFIANLKYFNIIDMPAYLKYDSTDICRIRLRMRMNRAKTSRLLHLYDNNHRSSCPSCNHPYDDLQHILQNCPQFAVQRQTCYDDIFKLTNINNQQDNLKILLGFIDNYDRTLHQPLLTVTANFISHIIKFREL
jgi:hypothetical protein